VKGTRIVQHDYAALATPANGGLRVPQVLENLIQKKEIPVTIGIFITPGQRGDTYPDTIGTGNGNNRAQEYDSLTDTYARFIIEEMLPEVGKSYSLATDPARRATSIAYRPARNGNRWFPAAIFIPL
jgi:enterochelin esterase-like enzyme